MDDPKVIAARYAKEANEAIDGAAQVAKDAYDKINADPRRSTPKTPSRRSSS